MDSIHWGINLLNISDWAIGAIVLFHFALNDSRIECVQQLLIDKYHLQSGPIIEDTSNGHDHTTAVIYECENWSQSNSDSIWRWYDVNNGMDSMVEDCWI
eukprot:252071_1